jgi:hypothetical protein
MNMGKRMNCRNLKVSSPSGDFEVLIKGAIVEKESVVLKVQMGVWNSKIHFSIGDIWYVAKVFFFPTVLLLFRLSLRFLFSYKREIDSK